ncbi:MAG: tripartite tricarboxylate transporter substrate binding protein [Betaproteobacteria bacterium]
MKKSFIAALLLCSVCTVAAQAQTYPNRSIRLVVPWAAGGPPDAVGRVLGQRVGDVLRQQIVIDNRPGANSIIGTEMVARAAPDGYTYLLTTGSHTTNAALHPKLPYDTLKDFTALTLVGESAGMVIGVHPSLPVKSVKELVALAKARPGQLTFGSAGNGNTLHLAGELFKAATGVNITHVPYKSATPALNDLLGGHIDMMFASPISLAGPIKAGRLRGLAQMGVRRSHLLPDLITLNELGIREAEIGGWYGLYAPSKTPREITDRMLAEVLKALKEPEVREKIGNLGAEPVGMPSDEFARFILADIEKYTRLGRRINLKLSD